MNERNLIPEAIEYLSKSDEERILYCKKIHWIGYGAAVKLIEILEDKFLDPPQMRHEGLLYMVIQIMENSNIKKCMNYIKQNLIMSQKMVKQFMKYQ